MGHLVFRTPYSHIYAEFVRGKVHFIERGNMIGFRFERTHFWRGGVKRLISDVQMWEDTFGWRARELKVQPQRYILPASKVP